MPDTPHATPPGNRWSAVLLTFAALYERSQAGRTGQGERDFTADFRDLLRQSGCADGEPRAQALRDLESAAQTGLLRLEHHRHDRHLIEKVRLSLAGEETFFQHLGVPSPAARRTSLAAQFAAAADLPVPAEWAQAWRLGCELLAQAAREGGSVAPFSREHPEENQELLELLPRLLAWRGESLRRFASCVLCGQSKRLDELAGRLGQALRLLSGDRVTSLDDLGILDKPRSVLVSGPLVLELPAGAINLGLLTGPYRVSELDLAAALRINTTATRVLTVENETTFLELSRLAAGDLLVQTSYPGSATRRLLSRLPTGLEFWHFGDSDPEGFDILRDLRERTGLPFRSLHMTWRGQVAGPSLTAESRRLLDRLLADPPLAAKHEVLRQLQASPHLGAYEQESLGRPTLGQWPYYPR